MLGHELTHIRNGDVQMMVVAVIIAGVVGFFGELFFRLFTNLTWSSAAAAGLVLVVLVLFIVVLLFSDRKGSGGGAIIVIIIAVVLIMLAWLLSQVVKLALSRTREYLADAGSVELTKNPDAMISALRKIEGRGELPGATSAVMELCVDNPREGFADLFATHPSVELARPGAGEIRRRPRSRSAGAADGTPARPAETSRRQRRRSSADRCRGGPWGDASAPSRTGRARRGPGDQAARGAGTPGFARLSAMRAINGNSRHE